MTIERKFRGYYKSDENPIWVYGFYYEEKGEHFIKHGSVAYLVDKESVGQFTGLLDKLVKEIYSGDLISAPEGDSRIYKIKWNDSDFRWGAFIVGGSGERVFSDMKNGEVIGNIYSNPDLIKIT